MYFPYFSAPNRSPGYLKIISLTTVSASITWKPLPNFFLNGKLTKYSLTLKEADTNKLTSYSTDEEKIECVGLRPFTKYSVQVAACTSAGCGRMSQELFFTTAEEGILIIMPFVFCKTVS